jgi:hypothetical protein
MLLLYTLMIQVPIYIYPLLWQVFIVAIEPVCELQADLTAIPPSEFTRKKGPDGAFYYKLLYAIAMTFKNSITFELIFNGKAYETIFAKY